MSTASASPAERRAGTLVWDAPVRVFHWLLAACFAMAWLSSESERWQLAHITAGYTMAGLVAFRLVWGLVGTRHARFRDFVRGPWAAIEYLDSLADRRPQHHVGHNPAGGLAIVALLALAALTAASGWAYDGRIGGRWMEELHELLANSLLGLVALHLVAVVVFGQQDPHAAFSAGGGAPGPRRPLRRPAPTATAATRTRARPPAAPPPPCARGGGSRRRTGPACGRGSSRPPGFPGAAGC